MKLVIERVTNGFILYNPDDMGETYLAFEEPFDPEYNPDPETMARLLRSVVDYFGAGTRYDKKRVYVEVRPGDKVPSISGDRTDA
jgi:hypothetical protein